MKALVTGGNGFIGSHLVDRLLESGVEVRCLLRKTSDRRWLDGKEIEYLECDEVQHDGVPREAVRGVDIVFHVLGTLVARDLDHFRRVNVEPVRRLLKAGVANGQVRRFVLVGSQGAAGPNPQGCDRIREDQPCQPVSDYGRSKLEAEHVVQDFQDKIPCTIVRPSAMYGPRDVNFLKIFKSGHSKGSIPQIGREPKTIGLAHVRDVVEGIYQSALSEQAVGQTYFLASEECYSSEDLRAAMETVIGKKIKQQVIPDVVVKAMMLYADVMSHVFGKHVLLNRDRLTTLSYPRWVSDVSKAQRDFGYRQRISLIDGFRGTYQWYLGEGWL
jgi:dihydroflavonol-4-reductase